MAVCVPAVKPRFGATWVTVLAAAPAASSSKISERLSASVPVEVKVWSAPLSVTATYRAVTGVPTPLSMYSVQPASGVHPGGLRRWMETNSVEESESGATESEAEASTPRALSELSTCLIGVVVLTPDHSPIQAQQARMPSDHVAVAVVTDEGELPTCAVNTCRR